MKKEKQILECKVVQTHALAEGCVLMRLEHEEGEFPQMHPGQFVNILVPDTQGVFLRRPISVCNVENGRLWLFIKNAGKGTETLCKVKVGEYINLILPLGRGFEPPKKGKTPVLVGGGVGIAPILYLGTKLAAQGFKPVFILGAAKASSLAMLSEFAKLGQVFITTDDGTMGEQGNVLQHSCWNEFDVDEIALYCCGPTPMMKGIASYAHRHGIECQVSLENHMACGIGACLCCVQDTKQGHKCVCTTGPVFNIKDLLWE